MNEQCFQVALRVRKLLPNEDTMAWTVKQNTLHSINASSLDLASAVDSKDRRRMMSIDSTESQAFTYDYIEQDQKTQGLYVRLCRDLVKQALTGYHSTILCYGQTTSGKTYTTLGKSENPGILPCALRDVFTHKGQIKVWIQYIQIYNEQLDDLLNADASKITIIDDPQFGTQLQGAKRFRVKTFQEAIELLNEGEERRIYRATKIHDHSSRSHTLFKIYIESSSASKVKFSCLNLVDLAGSERLSETDQLSQSETGYINKSLFSLTNVINKLADRQKHIPFRDSKLTRLLRDSLGGNAYTLLVCCVSPARKNFIQTLSTLRFANRAKLIKNSPEVQVIVDTEDPRDKEIASLKQQVQALTAQLGKQRVQVAVSRERVCEQCLEIEPALFQEEGFRVLKQMEDAYTYTVLEQLSGQLHELTLNYYDSLNELRSRLHDSALGCVLNLMMKRLDEDDKITSKKQFLEHLNLPATPRQLMAQVNELSFWIETQQLENQLSAQKYNEVAQLFEGVYKPVESGDTLMPFIRDVLAYAQSMSPNDKIGLESLINLQQKVVKDSQNKALNSQYISVAALQVPCQEGPVYVWGSNQDGRIGLGDDISIVKNPTYLQDFAQISCGSHHTMALSAQGRVYIWGRGQKGQLGLQDIANVPKHLPFKDQIVQVACGWQHSLALDVCGRIFSWGYGEDGQLGHGDCQTLSQPRVIKDQTATSIYCGHSHSAFLNDRDQLLTFGSNWDGRCMLSEIGTVASPEVAIEDRLISVSLGVCHMGVVLATGQLFMAGVGSDGQLATHLDEDSAQTMVHERVAEDLGGSEDQVTLEKEVSTTGVLVERFAKGGCKQVACGDRFTVVLTTQGKVMTFGKHTFGRLGFKAKENVFEPSPILHDALSISVGCRHGAAVTKSKALYMWGFNFHHQLGLGNNDKDQEAPVKIGIEGSIHQISLGYFHSAALLQKQADSR